MLKRKAFEERLAERKKVERREDRRLALLSVGLGAAQLLFLRWADKHVVRGTRLAVAGSVFLIYMVLIAVLVWRRERKVRALSPRCPQCGGALRGMSERVALATGRCDKCGGEIFGLEESETPPPFEDVGARRDRP